ncbi:unnamed protein product [Nippostrongylus brasiliensis]|uniref:Uncharacterized protein n=1 Tax=Nippostrongylus brasiliensis TaxID=27835 RepID=A0A0N4YIT6_NIPBR|nr:unnamed protein product [Nippostrongylus brasiliensis]
MWTSDRSWSPGAPGDTKAETHGHTKETGAPPNKKSIGARCTGQASTRSAKEEVEERHQKRSRRGQSNIRRHPG